MIIKISLGLPDFSFNPLSPEQLVKMAVKLVNMGVAVLSFSHSSDLTVSETSQLCLFGDQSVEPPIFDQ